MDEVKCPVCGYISPAGTKMCPMCDTVLANPVYVSKAEKPDWAIVLISCNSAKLDVTKKVQEITGMTIKDAKELVDRAPEIIISNISHSDAELLEIEFQSVGATVIATSVDAARRIQANSRETRKINSKQLSDDDKLQRQKTNEELYRKENMGCLFWMLGLLIVLIICAAAFQIFKSLSPEPVEISQSSNNSETVQAVETITQTAPTEHQHDWRGSREAGFIMCHTCNELLDIESIRQKRGVDLTSVEKARIYWELDSNLTARKSNGQYLYTEDKAFSLVEEAFGVSRDYLKNNIWNTHASADYVKYYISAWK